MENSSEHFRIFAAGLEHAISRYGSLNEEDVSSLQKRQIEHLVNLEALWRKAVIKHKKGEDLYKAFIAYVCDERKNVLIARPFFRERQRLFTKYIATALKKRSFRRLYRFHVNWHFISFALKNIKWDSDSEVVNLAKQIAAARNELVEMNLPLAINRSRIFWSRTPKSHLSFMDFTSIATEGLLSAVDKFVLPYSKVFCSVAIGRMVGNFIEAYSDTMLHFYPSDARKIYRANKFISKRAKGQFEVSDLVEEVNKDVSNNQRTSATEITDLVAAASTVSADTKTPGDSDIPSDVARYEAPESYRPDVRYEKAEMTNAMYGATLKLSLIDRKLLRLKGIEVSLDV